MGQESKKFHITNEGVIYRVDDTGEITELGNVNSLSDTSIKKPNGPYPIVESVDTKIRYSLSEMEKLLCIGKGKGFNRFERKMLVKESSNVSALERFVEFGGTQWINILIARYEHGETFLEPVLLKAAQNQFSCIERLASCKRQYSSPIIYNTLHNYNIPRVNDALKANPNSPYYEVNFVPSTKKGGGCFGVLMLFIISTATIITYYLI